MTSMWRLLLLASHFAAGLALVVNINKRNSARVDVRTKANGAFGIESIQINSGSLCYLMGAKVKADRYKNFDGLWTVEDSLLELKRLCETAKLTVAGSDWQSMQTPLAGTYFGLGKLDEIAASIAETGARVLVVDEELSPGQQKNLQDRLRVQVIDRTMLILFIFAQRAKTKEAKLQVSSAQYKYMLPRLTSFLSVGAGMDAKGGGLGLKGSGETQLESDRRLFAKQLNKIDDELKAVQGQRDLFRAKRRESDMTPIVAVVGYTNAGKSTLLNRFCGSEEVYADDLLFATLDPTTRQVALPSGKSIMVSDTVGFIQKLPTRLVTSFRATLDELLDASVVLHVVDMSSPLAAVQIQSVQKIIYELGAQSTPQILVMNKADALSVRPTTPWAELSDDVVPVKIVATSAKDGRGIKALLKAIEDALRAQSVQIDFLLPWEKGNLLDEVHKAGSILSEEFTDKGTRVKAFVPFSLRNRIENAALEFTVL